jgi:hypothetical protein
MVVAEKNVNLFDDPHSYYLTSCPLHSYHTWVYGFLSQFYSLKLSALAEKVCHDLQRVHPDSEFIGMHARTDYQYLKDRTDNRMRRNITSKDTRAMMTHMESLVPQG